MSYSTVGLEEERSLGAHFVAASVVRDLYFCHNTITMS